MRTKSFWVVTVLSTVCASALLAERVSAGC
jgi:hypothetical protein